MRRTSPGVVCGVLVLGLSLAVIAQSESVPFSLPEASDMDPGAPLACQDFDAYVNANWYREHPISPTAETSDAYSEASHRVDEAIENMIAESAGSSARDPAHRVVRDFWNSGTDPRLAETVGTKSLRRELQRIGTVRTTRQARALFASPEYLRFVLDVRVSPDPGDPLAPVLYVEPARLGLPDRSYYLDESRSALRENYRGYVSSLLALAGYDPGIAQAESARIVELETRLAQAMYSAQQISRDQALSYNRVPIGDASRDSSIDWKGFFRGLGLKPPLTLSEVNPAYHRAVSAMLSGVAVDTLKAYLEFRLVAESAAFLGEDFRQADFNFVGKEISGRKEPMPRDKAVMQALNRNIGDALGFLYVNRAFGAKRKAAAGRIAIDIRDALLKRIVQLDWMGGETKAQARIKADAIAMKIGYPDRWVGWQGLDSSATDFLSNLGSARKFNLLRELQRLDQPIDRAQWYRSPHMINAYYRAQANEIVVPAGRLQPPFYFESADFPVNYGAIGAVMGHEMSHAFDDQGSRFDSVGRLRNWWSEDDRAKFDVLGEKLAEQYGRMDVLGGRRINGLLTLGENLADIGGLSAALDAMHKAAGSTPDPMIDGLSRLQRFFIAYAMSRRGIYSSRVLEYVLSSDPHSPPKQRINGSVRNLSEFQRAFSCKPGDPMFLPQGDRITIW